MEHVDIPPGEIHKPHNYEYANEAARLAATGFAAGDVGKLALQLNDLTYWILSATTPTWASLAATGPQGAQGIQGDPGIQGATGPQGDPGATTIEGIAGLQDKLDGKPDASGFPVDASGDYLCTLAYNETTRTVTVTQTGATFDIYCTGTKHTKTGAQSIAHTAVYGGHFIYFDAAGTLTTSQSPWDLLRTAPIAYVFWDSTNSRGLPFDERHHAGRDLYWHRNQHAAEGTKITSGFAATGYTLTDGSTDAAVTLAIATGRVEDEDIRIDTEALPDAGPYTIIERSGASGEWLITRTSVLPFLYTGNNLQYNQFTGATWQRTNVAEDRFTNVYVFATTALAASDVTPAPGSVQQCIFVPGQATHTTQALANAESVSALAWGSMPFQEIAPLYQLTFRYNASNPSAYTNTARCALMAVTRIVGNFASVTAAAQSDHGALTGLTDQDHPASAIVFTPAGSIVATDVQAAIEELGTEKAALTTNTFAGAQIGGVTALTSSGASIAINLATNNNFSHTTSENTTLAAPSNPVAGQSGVIVITQGATPRLLAYSTFWKTPGGNVPLLTAVAGAVDLFGYVVESATRATFQLLKDSK